MKPVPKTLACAICGTEFPQASLRAFSQLTPGIQAAMLAEHPDIGPDDLICRTDRAGARRRHLEAVLAAERGALTALDHQVLDSLQAESPLALDPVAMGLEDRTTGEVAADAVARFGGSWGFIMGFGVVLVVWMTVNVTGYLTGSFDPYPFILLNLVLSCIAALQAPIIMMSQRRQEAKDRIRSENDYKVNLKAELEIRHLHDKIDLHLTRQWERLTLIQQMQIELLEETAPDRPRR
ncbi:DUF1003 domain-containing protein [Rhodobacter ferrooxidans]|uniref:Cyclic nucleotide-binding protein n=1 Tax=Rhodobacter ferrooxidans TaxID=371731 RepID=C8S579_9RHOB|nr:DUF1003 domain-containing protein [Rhodobacter sp. SW2]EEW23875.1 protein of unknown function DUF1003 [Rhodobacter sp. SW2]